MNTLYNICYPRVTPMGQWIFKNANQAFSYLTDRILASGDYCANGTLREENIGFYIDNPEDNAITEEWRKWSHKYAEREWNWYLSHSRDVSELQKHAPAWKRMHGGDCQVNSNYGYQWQRNKQLDKVIQKLMRDPMTRQAWITLYDGKEQDDYEYDTPCTLNVGFKVEQNKDVEYLDMTVLMRSNDLILGFCNDQFCFSQLQKYVAACLNVDVGTYYHFAQDLHIYDPFSNVYPERIKKYLQERLEKVRKHNEKDS